MGNILAHGGAFLIHRALGGHESDDAARAHLVQRFGKEIVVDQEIVLVIAFIRQLEIAEGNIADCDIKKAVRQLRFLEALDSDGGFLIELLRDAPGNGIQLHAEDASICHALGLHPDKVADAAGGLQHVPVLKAQVLHCLIHSADHDRRGIEGCQCGFSRGAQFLVRQHFPQLRIMGIALIEEIRQPAPADVIREDALLVAVGQPMLGFQLFQELDCHDVMVEAFQRCSDADPVIRDLEISAVVAFDFRIEHGGRQFTARPGSGRSEDNLFFGGLRL